MFGWLVEGLLLVVSIVSLCTSMALMPQRETCPPGWVLTWGVRTQDLGGFPTGSYWCENPKTRHRTFGRINCTGGSKPIVANYRVVGCQR